MPHYYGETINSLKDGNIPRSKYLFIVLLGIWILIQAFSIGISFVDNYIVPKFHSYVRQFFFELIMERYNQNYQELKIGTILTKLIKLPWILDDISNQIQRFLLTNIILIVSNFVYLFRHHYSLGVMYLGCIGVVFIMARLYFNTCNANIKKVEELYDECHEEIEDTLQNLLSIYTARKIDDERNRISDINERTRVEQYNAGVCNRKFRIYFSIVNIFLFLALNYVAYRLFLKGKIPVASLVSIFILNYTILSSLVGLFESSKDFISVKSHIELIEKFINELPKNSDDTKLQSITKPENLDIVYRDVTYQPEGSKIKILDNFNLRIYPRQKIAIIGHAGSGKTSLVTLLTKIKGFQKGDIFINGVSINKLDTDELREKIVFIPQHPKLFNRTLAENLTYGLPSDITIDHISKFMRENGFTDLEKIFKKRLGEKVGKSGSNFSGGQKSLIWMIRAIMKPSSLVILDEPTSALDKDSREHVAKMIDIISSNRSIIIITHNFEMNDSMDRVITMEKGKIISDVTKAKGKKNN
ncbi:MAG: ABC transporter ATP-binding protein/permease [Proteobacteria bacterium]|nr:ABC transporter ATP-binding protein/permease [Pseudomonadota bacterium]